MHGDRDGHLGITDIPGLRVGQMSNEQAKTGCTVIIGPNQGFVAGVDVRGSAAGTRGLDILRPTSRIDRIHAICLCGGSGFGLGAVDGVMRYLAERGIGLDRGVATVPIVSAAVIFDLAFGLPLYPTPEDGYSACVAGEAAASVTEGSVGVGTGATVGKVWGMSHAMKGGVGTGGIRLPSGAIVAALVVTNAFGDIYDRQGRIVAGAKTTDGEFVDTCRAFLTGDQTSVIEPMDNTCLAVIATDASLTKAECQKVAELGHDAFAIAIRPVHTLYDGDTIFAASLGSLREDPVAIGVAAVEALRQAIARSVRSVGDRADAC